MRISILAVLVILISASGALACNTPQPTNVPNNTPTVIPADKVLTVEELVRNALANKFKRGQVIIVSGIIIGGGYSGGGFSEILGPPVNGFTVNLDYVLNANNGLQGLPTGTKVVVRARYCCVGSTMILLDNSVLVSKKYATE